MMQKFPSHPDFVDSVNRLKSKQFTSDALNTHKTLSQSKITEINKFSFAIATSISRFIKLSIYPEIKI